VQRGRDKERPLVSHEIQTPSHPGIERSATAPKGESVDTCRGCGPGTDGITRRTLLQAAVGVAAGTVLATSRPAAAEINPNPGATEVEAFDGTLVSATPSSLSVNVEGTVYPVPITGASMFWRGYETGVAALVPGDDVVVRTLGGNVDFAWANLATIRGKVVTPISGGYQVIRDDASTIDVLVNGGTMFEDAYTGDNTLPPSLPPASGIEAVGLSTGGAISASFLCYARSDVTPPPNPAEGPDEVSTTPPAWFSFDPTPPPVDNPESDPSSDPIQGPLYADRYVSYLGIASVFSCPTGSGACGSCRSSGSRQCAWPAMDTCGCCSSSCCDCSRGCKNQVRVRCAKKIWVNDPCASRTRWMRVVDCGPCQNALCGQCTGVCSHTSRNCNITRRATVIDLTKPTFSIFYNLHQRTSFPCAAAVHV
jgi:hypothetical protein